MKLRLVRSFLGPLYTIGHLYVDGQYVCDTIEDRNRDVNFNGRFDGQERKVAGETCIPFGSYEVTLGVRSPKFSQKAYYRQYCDGFVPRLLKVPSFEGILIHCGVNQNSSAGCIIVGYNKVKGRVVDSQKAFEKLYPMLKGASLRHERIVIDIVKG